MHTALSVVDAVSTVTDTYDMATRVAEQKDDQQSNPWISAAFVADGAVLPNVPRLGVGDEMLGLAKKGKRHSGGSASSLIDVSDGKSALKTSSGKTADSAVNSAEVVANTADSGLSRRNLNAGTSDYREVITNLSTAI